MCVYLSASQCDLVPCCRYSSTRLAESEAAALQDWLAGVRAVCFTRPLEDAAPHKGVVRVRGPSLSDEWSRMLQELRQGTSRRAPVNLIVIKMARS